MTEIRNDLPDIPVWARPDAFPQAPQGWGWVGANGTPHRCSSISELYAAIRNDADGSILLAWTPDNDWMVLPEEIPGAGSSVRAAREIWTRQDFQESSKRLRWFGLGLALFTLYTFSQNWQDTAHLARQAGTDFSWVDPLKKTVESIPLGIALLVFLIFALIPWYSAFKNRRGMATWTEEKLEEKLPYIRFETWLERQKAPVTYSLLALLGVVYIVQHFAADAVHSAGLVKENYLAGEWWRLFTAPLLHAPAPNILHILMNGSAMLYLGRRMEVFARWPHLPMVFLFSAAVGGEASVRFLAQNGVTIGASGGLMGWLGFLLIFETLHTRLVPRHARRRLIAGVLLTALIGLIGYRYIDNAAHAGGMLAGMLYAAIVFPKSSSALRPGTTITDKITGVLSFVILVIAGGFAVWKMF